MSLNFIHYPSSEITDLMREDPCYPPPRPLQLTDAPSPESFDQEVDSDEEVSTYLPSEQIDALFSATGTRDTNPAISTTISTPSTITSSTDSSSQYSFSITPSESEYLKLSEFETHDSVNSRLYSMQAFISSPEFTNPLPCIPPVNLAEVRGTMDLNPSFFADNYSTPVQLESATCVNPAALSRAGGIDTALSPHVISDSGAQMAPVKKPLKPFKCPLCPFSSARMHNLKTHVGTHDKEASKRFGCSTCGRRLSRKHDLRRHRETIHGVQMSSSSSASSVSSGRFDRKPDTPQYHTTTVSRDEQLKSSHHQGSFSATGLEASWLVGSERLGCGERERYRNHEGSLHLESL